MARRLVDVQPRSLTTSQIAPGSWIAQVIGRPLGRACGLAQGWRMTFGLVYVYTTTYLALLAAVLPTISSGRPFSLARLPYHYPNRPLVVMFGATMLFAPGYSTSYSDIEPFLQQVASIEASQISVSRTVSSSEGIPGNMLSACLFDGRSRVFVAR